MGRTKKIRFPLVQRQKIYMSCYDLKKRNASFWEMKIYIEEYLFLLVNEVFISVCHCKLNSPVREGSITILKIRL